MSRVVKESEENVQSGDFEEAMHERSHENSRVASPEQATQANFRKSPKQSVIHETSNDDTGQDANFYDVSLIHPEGNHYVSGEQPKENQILELDD